MARFPPPTPFVRRKYSIDELLWMRKTLKHLVCPIPKFSMDAWQYGIIRVYSSGLKADVRSANRQQRQRQLQMTPQQQNSLHRQMPNPQNGGPQNHLNRGKVNIQFSDQQPYLNRRGGNTQFGGQQTHTNRHASQARLPPPTGFQPGGAMRPRIELDRIASVVYASGDVNDTLRQGMMRTALRYYPQAAARAPVTIPVAQNMVFTGFISPMILGGRDMEEKPAQPVRVSVPMNKSPIPSPKDLYGGYPAVTLGAAGCVKGTVQGFVPGGTLKSVPITAVSPVVEKDQEPFDASKWVFTFPETADIKAQVKSPGNSFNLQAAAGKAEVSNDGLASGKGKAKETLVATGEESRIATDEELVVAPPPMLGIRSAHEHQMAFIKFMKQKNRSPSITPQKKENKATSFTPGEVETIVGNGATW